MDAERTIVLDGHSLTSSQLRLVAAGAPVAVHPSARDRVAAGRNVVERYFREGIPAYGLTTGLGMRADQMLSVAAAEAFSYKTVRGRSQSVGEPLAPEVVRAIMAVRLNTMLTGGSGGSPTVADALCDALNAGAVPAMRRIGSIGAADLVVMAALPAALIGEGELLVEGKVIPAQEGLRSLGLRPLRLAPKDGMVLCNSTAFSAATGALAAEGARDLLGALQCSAALSMEGFRANLSPIGDQALRVRPQPGQVAMGDQLRALLADGPLGIPGSARRLQDPLSFRCVAQVHGAALASLLELEQELEIDLNFPPDNPVVLVDEDLCVSVGNFHLPRLAQTLDAVARSLAWCVNDSVARVHRLMHSPFTALPALLTSDAPDHAGFGPVLKPLESLRAEIIHLANPVPILPSHNADGVEDSATFAPLAARNLEQLVELSALVVAIELVVGCQAIDLRDPQFAASTAAARVGTNGVRPLQDAYAMVREIVGFVDEDRPLGRQLEQIAAELVRSGGLASVVASVTVDA